MLEWTNEEIAFAWWHHIFMIIVTKHINRMLQTWFSHGAKSKWPYMRKFTWKIHLFACKYTQSECELVPWNLSLDVAYNMIVLEELAVTIKIYWLPDMEGIAFSSRSIDRGNVLFSSLNMTDLGYLIWPSRIIGECTRKQLHFSYIRSASDPRPWLIAHS